MTDAEKKLNRLNLWLVIVTVTVALIYAGWNIYRAVNNKCPCDDGCTCWRPEDDNQ